MRQRPQAIKVMLPSARVPRHPGFLLTTGGDNLLGSYLFLQSETIVVAGSSFP